jgi:hypothetical protein
MKKILLATLITAFLLGSGCTKKSDAPPAVTSANPQADTGIMGTIELAPLLERNPISKDAVIYLIARNPGETMGPPIAVKRIVQPFHFPITFTLSKADAMLPDAPFVGPFALTVRIAQSGSATPAQAGDLEGEVPTGPVELGKKDVALRIAKVRP